MVIKNMTTNELVEKIKELADKYYDQQEIARILGISQPTVSRLIKAHGICDLSHYYKQYIAKCKNKIKKSLIPIVESPPEQYISVDMSEITYRRQRGHQRRKLTHYLLIGRVVKNKKVIDTILLVSNKYNKEAIIGFWELILQSGYTLNVTGDYAIISQLPNSIAFLFRRAKWEASRNQCDKWVGGIKYKVYMKIVAYKEKNNLKWSEIEREPQHISQVMKFYDQVFEHLGIKYYGIKLTSRE
ncbi:MAG: DUF3853 family protein, partial [Candidatus Methanosuratincola petrocarbonis]